MAADLTRDLPTEGDVITYDHPDWGRSGGTVIRVDAGKVHVESSVPGSILVQDHAPNGAREWISPEWIVGGAS